jgi:AcrR family transcriptional regulator
MQTKKSEIRQNILTESKKEFFKYGFEGMSIRRVASSAGISPSNIYNYFKNKDEIFCEIVKPASDFLKLILKNAEIKEYDTIETPEAIEWHLNFINMIYKLISDYREPLKLLLSHSDGTAHHGFKENLAKRYAAIQPCASGDKNAISEFFMYNFTLFYINYLESLITEELDDYSVKKHLVELTIYSHSGFVTMTSGNNELYNMLIEKIGTPL